MHYFNKIPHPANFRYVDASSGGAWQLGEERLPVRLAGNGQGVFRLQSPLRHPAPNPSQAELDFVETPDGTATGDFSLRIRPEDGGLVLANSTGLALLESISQRALGCCGRAHVLCFGHGDDFRYYGMGEKLLGLELTGVRTRFWNTDAFGDFDGATVMGARTDPLYASIPYLIVRTPAGWAGLLMNNAYSSFMSTAADVAIEGFQAAESGAGKMIVLGAQDGPLDLFVLAGTTLSELTRRLQQLVGTTPLPPLWALGYHQCRWGYRSAEDLRELQRRFAEQEIPVDGLWLDIDYMDGFRVFTFDRNAFPDPREDIAAITAAGQRVVPILDPGVKRDPIFDVYQEGRQQDLFCHNPEGGEFVGVVWPGETAFPDFSLPEARDWWAAHVRRLAETGIEGAWIDMNDPSVGASNPFDMRFDRGQALHETYHNQYATGMAQATRDGFLRARPNQRPFVISRSNFLAGARHAAVWTGDNASNYEHLRKGIATSLNLALSGIPFNGGDIGGFAGDASPRLLRDWMRASFLLPFCRNHSALHTAPQEPWSRDALTLETMREFIRSRYKLLPFLYQLFIAQEETGEAILRPLFHDFDNTPGLELDRVDDAFLVGPNLLQAPILSPDSDQRDIPLPGPAQWFALLDQSWRDGGQRMTNIEIPETATALFFRAGSIIPMRPGIPMDHRTHLQDVELHLFLAGDGQAAPLNYAADDGLTFAYRQGKRSRLLVEAVASGSTVEIKARLAVAGAGPIRAAVVIHGPFSAIRVNGSDAPAKAHSTRLAGCVLDGIGTEAYSFDAL